jgi:outer membrane receptor protein involved in Fe transport
MPRRLSLALAPMLLAPLLLAAQVQLSRLAGLVVDAANQPVAAARVTISDSVGGVLRAVTTDAAGRFVVDLSPGRYAIAAEAGGGPPAARHGVPAIVTVADGLAASVTVRLQPLFRDAVVVDATRPMASVASRTSIGAASIERTPVRLQARGLQEAVATLPGWSTEDNGLLHNRGVDDGFLYVVDGVPVYERLDQLSGLAPDARTIDALTVVTGYVPPEFGYKSGGVIEVRTRSASGPWRGLAAVGGGSDSALDGEISTGGALGDHGSLFLQAASQRSTRYLDPVDPGNLHNRGGLTGIAGQFTAGTPARDRVVTSWQLGRARFDVPNTRAQEDAGQAARQAAGQGSATTSWQRTSSATVTQIAGYVRGGTARLDPSAGDTPITAEADRRLTRAGALAGVTRQAGRHVLKAGTEIQQLRLTEHFGFAVTDQDAGEEAGLSEAALAFDADDPFRFDGTARPWLWSAYAQDTWQATPALTVAAGLRFDRTRQLVPRQQWSPRLGAAFAASPATTLRASVSRFYQPPQPEHLLLASSLEARELSPIREDGSAGGADIEPERQWAYEAGVEHRFGRGWRLDVAGWDRRVREYADPNVFFGTAIIFPNAVAQGHARGVDARIEAAPGGPWSAYANLSVSKVTQTGPITGGLFLEDDVADIGPGVEFVPDHDQRVVASGGLTWTGGRGVTLSAAARYESGTPLELDDDAEADALAARPGADRVDLARGRVRPRAIVSLVGGVPVWTKPRAVVSVRAAVLNLFGARYAYNFGNPFSGTHFGAPRTAAVTLRVETR